MVAGLSTPPAAALKAVLRSGRTRKLKLPSLVAVTDLRGAKPSVGKASERNWTCAPGVAVPWSVTTCPNAMLRLLADIVTDDACAPAPAVPELVVPPPPAVCVGPAAGWVPEQR